MSTEYLPLKIIKFKATDFDLVELSTRLTALKSQASRTPTSVTTQQLKDISDSPTNILLLQIVDNKTNTVVGMVHIAVIHLEDRVHIGPISIDAKSVPRGHGTPLMEAAIEYVKQNFPAVRRIDLTNRPSHDLAVWYKKFGFVSRTEETGDPSTIYRLSLR